MRSLVIAALACWQLALCGCAAVASVAAAHPAVIAAITDAAPAVLAAGAVGAIGIAGIASARRESYAAGTLGAFLQESQAAVRSMVQDAMLTQRVPAVVAGLQVQRAIARAYIAFDDSLDAKADALGAAQKGFEAEIASAIATLRQGTNPEIRKAGDRAQALAEQLRRGGDAPQLRSYGPIFLFPFLPSQSIRVGGSFPAAYPDAAVPQLTLNGKSYKAFAYEAQSLEFSLPMPGLDAVEPEAILWRIGELTIPWNKPALDSNYKAGYENFVVIGVLPHAFGRVSIEHRSGAGSREEFDLAWGSRRVFGYAAGTWKLRYAQFGGGQTEVESSDLSNPLVRISADARSVTISTYPF